MRATNYNARTAMLISRGSFGIMNELLCVCRVCFMNNHTKAISDFRCTWDWRRRSVPPRCRRIHSRFGFAPAIRPDICHVGFQIVGYVSRVRCAMLTCRPCKPIAMTASRVTDQGTARMALSETSTGIRGSWGSGMTPRLEKDYVVRFQMITGAPSCTY